MTVDEFINAQPQRELLVALRTLVRRIVPEAREEMKWRVPFYSHHGMLCCFEMSGRDAVVMCFCWGAELEDPEGILGGEWRRTRTVVIRTLRDVRGRALADMLRRAVARNETRRRSPRRHSPTAR
jgi:hypothetical protein